MAERYGQLPSKVLTEATTTDLFIFDVAVSYRNEVNRRETVKSGGRVDPAKYDLKQLQKKLEDFKNGNEDKNRK